MAVLHLVHVDEGAEVDLVSCPCVALEGSEQPMPGCVQGKAGDCIDKRTPDSDSGPHYMTRGALPSQMHPDSAKSHEVA